MTCQYCKKKIPPESIYCMFCGRKVNKAVSGHRRGNGLGSVFQMPSGSYAAEITIGFYTQNGKLKRKYSRKYGFKTKKEAVMYLETLRDNKQALLSPTFADLFGRIDISNPKQYAYNKAWERVAPYLASRKIADVSSAELQEVAEIAETYYTRRDIKTVLSKCYQLAMRDELVNINKAQFIELPPKEQTERLTFTDDQIALLWLDFKAPSLVTAAALLMLYTGMRTGECKGLKRENIHLAEHYCTGGIKTDKGKNRKIIIPDKLMPVFEYLLQGSDELLFDVGKNYLPEQWQKKREQFGFPEQLTLYCCRHTYITRLTALGVSPAMLQELAGHEDYETTLNYTHLSIADRLREVNRLD